jgi:hypothetical protein
VAADLAKPDLAKTEAPGQTGVEEQHVLPTQKKGTKLAMAGVPAPMPGTNHLAQLPEANMSVHYKSPPMSAIATSEAAGASLAQHANGGADGWQTAAEPAVLAALQQQALAQENPAGGNPGIAAPKPVADQTGPFHIQVGSFADATSAETRLAAVSQKAGPVLKNHPSFTMQAALPKGAVFRARYGGFAEAQAKTACASLKRKAVDCMVVRAE